MGEGHDTLGTARERLLKNARRIGDMDVTYQEARDEGLMCQEFRAHGMMVRVHGGKGEEVPFVPGEKTPLVVRMKWFYEHHKTLRPFAYLDVFAALVRQQQIAKGDVTFHRLGWHDGEPGCSFTVHPKSERLADAYLEVQQVFADLRAAVSACDTALLSIPAGGLEHWASPTRSVCAYCMVVEHCSDDLDWVDYYDYLRAAVVERAEERGDVAVLEVDDRDRLQWITIDAGAGDPATLHERAWEIEQQLHEAARAAAFLDYLSWGLDDDDVDDEADDQAEDE